MLSAGSPAGANGGLLHAGGGSGGIPVPAATPSGGDRGGPGIAAGATPSSTTTLSSPASASQQPNAPAIWDFDTPMLNAWVQQSAPLHPDPNLSGQLWSQLLLSLESLRETVETVEPDHFSNGNDDGDDNNEHDDGGMDGPESRRKRRKKVVTIRTLHDPYHLWISAWKDRPRGDGPSQVVGDDADDMPSTTGGKIAQLTLGGMVNAIVGVVGGVTHQTVPSLSAIKARHAELTANGAALGPTVPPLDATALYETAARLHRACATRIQADVLRTTPLRIQDMLASDLSPQEFAGIRKRIVDTVVRGKGRALLVEDEADDLAVAPPAVAANAQSTAEKYQKCGTCGNHDQAIFVLDRKNGDIICSNCGTVVSESIMHEGSQYRKFEGEVDRNHHGDAANPLFSNASNMSTSLGGTTMTTMTRGMGGGGGKSNLETILRNAHAYTELNLSNFGRSDRRTRTGYKDKQKKEAFVQMAHVGDALNLHEAVIQRAKELFAGFRDDRELVQQFKGVIGACLSIAFEQLSEEGRAILKSAEQAEAAFATNDPDGKQRALSARAARRNQLHHANLAGKGGLLLDFSNVETKSDASNLLSNASASAASSSAASTSPKATDKPAASWDLLDCRSWLLDASRRIAQQWVEERNAGTPASKSIPPGTLEELEGQLVEHSITLCEHLEKEANESASASTTAAAKRKVVTPRVQDMSKLGIKWQHNRGNGGKGAFGGTGAGSSRTAGQVLILKTAKKLGEILKDPFAGEALHKELRGMLAQQETRKQRLIREEASRQRLQQMKRKPWLQAKIQA